MNDFKADLHCHTTFSDGSMTPQQVIELAKEKGLSALSITDHDTISAYSIAEPIAIKNGLKLLPGVELSTMLDGISVHILAYGFKTDDENMILFCNRHTERRKIRNEMILDLLKKHKMPLTMEDLIPQNTPQTHTVGRPHIASAMVAKGYVESFQEAFKKYIGEGRPCYTSGHHFTVEETLDLIKKSKGLAVIAHPHLIKNESIIAKLMTMPFDGMECYYANFSLAQNKRWLKIATKKNWLITGGSDFHGEIKPQISLGASFTPQDEFNKLITSLN